MLHATQRRLLPAARRGSIITVAIGLAHRRQAIGAAARKGHDMTALATRCARCGNAIARSAAVFLRDVGSGLLEVSHNTLALVGLVVVAALSSPSVAPTCATASSKHAFGWLQARHEARADPADDSVARRRSPSRRRCPRHRDRPERADPPAGERRALDLAPLPRRARADQPRWCKEAWVDRRAGPASTRR